MSGHSKWSTIKHKKAKTDAQRGKVFSKVAREIVMAVKLGGDDADMNPRLRLALQKAKACNMPNDNVKRAVQKGAGPGEDSNYEELTYEAYATHGVAMMISTLTDNRHRTIANIKAIVSRGGGSMATPGAVSYQFSSKGFFLFAPGVDEDAVMEAALDADAENFEMQDDGSIEVVTTPDTFDAVRDSFESNNLEYESAEVTKVSATTVTLSQEDGEKILALIDKLDDDDDVQDVYTNFEII
jgi:YebC/PmpR family DNA-binding regulatory protein